MNTLHIEHPITDYGTWRAAFDRFAPARERAGVLNQRVRQPVDDQRYVVIDLDFPDPDAAAQFLTFLHDVVWATPESSPGLDGTPQARVLSDRD
jgi:hypothetical protein